MSTKEGRARLRALCEAATKGEWIAKTFKTAYLSTGGGEHEVRDRPTGRTLARLEFDGPEDKAQSVADCEFIAAAKTALPELLGEVERLEKAVAEARRSESAAIEHAAFTDWLVSAMRGEPVSDFALSFPEVSEAADLYQRAALTGEKP